MSTSEAIQTTWYEEKYYSAGSGLNIPFLVFPLSTEEQVSGIENYVPLHPVFQKEKVEPFSAIFFLKEKPNPDNENLWDLTEKAIFKLRMSLVLPPEATDDHLKPVFLHKAVVRITDGKDHIYAAATKNDVFNPDFTLSGELSSKEDLEQLLLLIQKESNKFHIQSKLRFHGPEQEEKSFESLYPLRNLFKAEEELVPADFVDIRYFDEKEGNYKSIPKKISFLEKTRKPRSAGEVKLIRNDGKASTINSNLKPNVNLAAHQVINSNISVSNQGLYKIDDIQVALRPESRPRSLPVVDKPDKVVWKDRRNRNKFWYAPEYNLLVPSQSTDPEKAPFRFIFKKVGTDAMGNPVLEGEVQLTLQITPPAEVNTENDSKTFKQVRTFSESYRMEVPFTTTDGKQSVSEIPAESFEKNRKKIRIYIQAHQSMDQGVLCCHVD